MQEIAATCVFLAAKIEENSRKLKDVATIAMAKTTGIHPEKIDQNSDVCAHRSTSIYLMQTVTQEFRRWTSAILAREELLVETLCFDFLVHHPHSILVDLLQSMPEDTILEDHSWSIANDS
jgi:hypothetical protein